MHTIVQLAVAELFVPVLNHMDGDSMSPSSRSWRRTTRIMSRLTVPISTEPSFTPGQPRRLFESNLLRGQVLWRGYDVFPGGQRFVTFAPSEDGNTAPTTIRVVQNWYEEFRDRKQD